MLLPGNWDDRRAVQTLALSTGGGVLLGDQGYIGDQGYSGGLQWRRDLRLALREGPNSSCDAVLFV